MNFNSEHLVYTLHQTLTVISWLFGAAAIIVAIQIFRHREKEILSWIIAELVCDIAVGVCLLVFPFLDARLDHFNEIRIGNDEKTIGVLSNQLSEAESDLSAAKIKPLKERIIDLLNSIDPKILQRMAQSPISVSFSGNMSTENFSELKKLAAEPGAWQYLQIEDGLHGFAWSNNGTESVTDIKFWLYPALIKNK